MKIYLRKNLLQILKKMDPLKVKMDLQRGKVLLKVKKVS